MNENENNQPMQGPPANESAPVESPASASEARSGYLSSFISTTTSLATPSDGYNYRTNDPLGIEGQRARLSQGGLDDRADDILWQVERRLRRDEGLRQTFEDYEKAAAEYKAARGSFAQSGPITRMALLERKLQRAFDRSVTTYALAVLKGNLQ